MVPTASVEDIIKEGQQLLDKGEYKKAYNAFEKAIKEDPGNAAAHFGKAESTMGLPKYTPQEISAFYRKAIELDAENVFFRTAYADFCLSSGWLKPGEEHYLKAVQLDPENAAQYLSELAVAYYDAGNNFIDMMPNVTREQIAKSALTYALKAFDLAPDKAKPLLEELVKSAPKALKVDDAAAKSLAKDAEAKEILDLIAKEPNNPLNLTQMGQYCFEHAKPELAEAYYLKAADMDPDNAQYYFGDLAVGAYLAGKKGDKTVVSKAVYYSLKAMGFDPKRVVDILYGK